MNNDKITVETLVKNVMPEIRRGLEFIVRVESARKNERQFGKYAHKGALVRDLVQ